MAKKSYDHLSREDLIALLYKRDVDRKLGLVWERDEIEHETALNNDFVALDLDESLSVGDGPHRNLIIEGDNFDALRYLSIAYKGRVKCIYIDPPYNTGNRDFLYNDHYVDKDDRYRHSKWLEFMHRRLSLAKSLLRHDGVIFVSIDDNEIFHLGLLMEQIFGPSNFVANVIWQKVYSPKGTALHFSDDHEYIICYALNKETWRPNPMPRSVAQDKAYKNLDKDRRGPWKAGDLSARNYYSKGTYSITCPSGRVVAGPPPGNYWRFAEEKFLELDRDGRIWWGKDGNNVPALKRFLSDVKQGVVPQTLWKYEEVGHTQDAKKEIHDILQFETSGDVFSTPKPVALMERIMRIATNPGDIVLDFFAGSGTTAQAVLNLNKEDGGQRKFILVSSTEATPGEITKNICRDICAERVKRVIKGYTNKKGVAVDELGGEFAYLRAVRIPRERLHSDISHNQLWIALQQLHAGVIQPYRKSEVHLLDIADTDLYYVEKVSKNVVAALEERAKQRKPAVIYSWQPGLLQQRILCQHFAFEKIPEYLVNRFGSQP